MSQRSPFDPPVPAAPKKRGAGVIVLLVLLTFSNLGGLLLGVLGWADEASHGREWDDAPLRAAVFVTLVSAIAVVGLVGAWMTRKWGPRLYVATAGLGLVLGLVSGGFSPLSLVGIALAVGLWIHAENSW